MATATTTADPVQAPARTVQGDQRVVMRGIGWEGYLTMLRLQGERSRPQMVYLDGDLLLMSPSVIHERLNDRLGMFVRAVVEELDIPCEPTKETTFRGPGEDTGVQPDDSFYLANYELIAAKDGKKDIDLRVDPPPDLVIEVVHTHPATAAVEVLRRLGVPEVWVCDAAGLRILVRHADGHYLESETSRAFPFLSAVEIFEWATRPGMASMTQWIKELRLWVREVLIPRAR